MEKYFGNFDIYLFITLVIMLISISGSYINLNSKINNKIELVIKQFTDIDTDILARYSKEMTHLDTMIDKNDNGILLKDKTYVKELYISKLPTTSGETFENTDKGTLTVSGTTKTEDLEVTNNTKSTNLEVTNKTKSKDLEVTNNTKCKDLEVTNNTKSTNLEVTNKTTTTDLEVTNNTKSKDLEVTNKTITTDLEVTNKTITTDLEVNNNVVVTNNITTSSLDVNNNVGVSNKTTTTDLQVNNNVGVANNITTSSLDVNSIAQIHGNCQISGNLQVNGDVTFLNKNSNIMEIFPRYMVLAWASLENIPKGWAPCNGKKYTMDAYGIFSESDEGIQTPDLRGRFVLGSNPETFTDTKNNIISQRTLDEQDGSEKHTLTIEQIPRHSHSISWGNVGCVGDRCGRRDTWVGTDNVRSEQGVPFNSDADPLNYPHITGEIGGKLKPGSNPPQYETESHNNMPPYYVLIYIMKL